LATRGPKLWLSGLGLDLRQWSFLQQLILVRFVAFVTSFVRVLSLYTVGVDVTVFPPGDAINTQRFFFKRAIFILEAPRDATVSVVVAVLPQNLYRWFAPPSRRCRTTTLVVQVLRGLPSGVVTSGRLSDGLRRLDRYLLTYLHNSLELI
jgi:hypothetical protein